MLTPPNLLEYEVHGLNHLLWTPEKNTGIDQTQIPLPQHKGFRRKANEKGLWSPQNFQQGHILKGVSSSPTSEEVTSPRSGHMRALWKLETLTVLHHRFLKFIHTHRTLKTITDNYYDLLYPTKCKLIHRSGILWCSHRTLIKFTNLHTLRSTYLVTLTY